MTHIHDRHMSVKDYSINDKHGGIGMEEKSQDNKRPLVIAKKDIVV